MKSFLKIILKHYLKYLTKIVLAVHRPTVIAVAGSTNKTFIKEEISRLLRQEGIAIRSNPRSFNTEIGLPLAILGLPSGYNSYRDWLPIITSALKKIFKMNFPKYLVLEFGVSNHGDMKYLLSIVKPKVGIVSNITQRYLEGFADMDGLVGEYELFAKSIKPGGLLILNYDNARIKTIGRKAKIKIKTFGLSPGADWRAEKITKTNDGQAFEVVNLAENNGHFKNYRINLFGLHHIYAALAALIVKKYVTEEEKNKKKRL